MNNKEKKMTICAVFDGRPWASCTRGLEGCVCGMEDPRRVAMLLAQHNKWRRGDGYDAVCASPIAIGSAIDSAVAMLIKLADKEGAPPVQPADSTPKLTVGYSSFESWYEAQEGPWTGDKQLARDAYAAGMADRAALAQPSEPSLRPTFGAIGSRDVDVAAAQKAWDAAQPLQPAAELKALRIAGDALSNIAYNLAQHAGSILTANQCKSMEQCRKAWDSAVSTKETP